MIMGLIWLLISPLEFMFGLTGAVCALSVFFTAMRAIAILTPKPQRYTGLTLDDWPKYTVLVPLLNEAHMVKSLMSGLSELDYPQDSLEIMMICEARDMRTIAAVQRNLTPPFDIVVVPPGGPRTKPNALNYAFQSATGDIITIYDAEDRPASEQLKAAASALQAHPEWASVQAPLDYFNAGENWLTRQFALEYAAHFHVWLPFLARLGLPYPMGGTSNHIRTSALKMVDGWDAHNVTEDADLSFRLAAHRWRLGFIHPPTQEEAVKYYKPWRDQRSRWMKGFMQTWLTHMTVPIMPVGPVGIARQFTLQITIGLALVAGFFHVPAALLTLYTLAITDFLGHRIDIPSLFIGAVSFSYIVGILIGAAGAIRAGKPKLLLALPLMPLYWLLLFAPTILAFRELSRDPYYWNKTEHGVTDTQPELRQEESYDTFA